MIRDLVPASNPGLVLALEACRRPAAGLVPLGPAENNASIRISAALAMITLSTILFSRLRGLFFPM